MLYDYQLAKDSDYNKQKGIFSTLILNIFD